MSGEKVEVGFLGGGRMASAVREGLLSKGENRVGVFDPEEGAARTWRERGCTVFDTPGELFAACRWLVLAVKPQTYRSCKENWRKLNFSGTGWISIMAGISLSDMEALRPGLPIVRTMPNTPMMVNLGVVALCGGKNAGEEHLARVEELFAPVAHTLRVKEDQMDGVTALSGSGPAYIFYLTEEIARRGKALNLDPEQILKLWTRTLEGAALMLAGGGDPGELRRQVTSPGGTTEAALKLFDARALSEIFGEGLVKACERSKELRS
ncbi:MAG: pyrroline-5-carboxylate reductase [Planctomycetes bacterium]|nr:pyrroline-5-carboxylate reductase [Planctomycetota bacterium]